MESRNLIAASQAARLNTLETGDFSAVLSLASFGMNAKAIHDYVVAVAAGKNPGTPVVNTAPAPLKIIAWSFVRDFNQYNGVYGLSSSEAGDLKDLLTAQPREAAEKIQALVSEKLRRVGSERPVIVETKTVGGGSSASRSSGPGDDGGLRRLKQVIRGNSGLYGMYSFDPVATGNHGHTAFIVPLGMSLYACGQSKELARTVARVCRVEGRFSQNVVNNIAFSSDRQNFAFGTNIPEKLPFDGKLGAADKPPPDPVRVARSTILENERNKPDDDSSRVGGRQSR